MHRTQLLIANDEWYALKAIAAFQGKSVGELIREHLKELVVREAPKKWIALDKLCGLVVDEPKASRKIDSYLYKKRV